MANPWINKYKLEGCPGPTCWAHMILIFDLDPTWTNVSSGTSTHGEHLCKFILKSIQILGVMVQTKIWSSSVTLTLDLPERMFQKVHLHMREQLCQIILKSIHNCRSYSTYKIGQTDGHTNANTYRISLNPFPKDKF